MKDIHQILSGKWEDGTRPIDIYNLYISKNPQSYLEQLIGGLQSTNSRIRNGCAELTSLLSENRPDLLYPHIDLFLRNLTAKEKVLLWEAVCTLGNLAKVDRDQKTAAAIDSMIGFLKNKSIVLQVHSLRALGKIAKAQSDKAVTILDAILEVTEFFPGNRVGFIIEVMDYFLERKELLPKVKELIEKYLDSEIKVVARKANQIYKRLPST
ncbi:MAG: hypothetical protein ACFFDP_01920 [Promethearchaeota archaeon]